MKLKYIFSVLLVVLISGCIGGSDTTTSPVIQGDSGIEFSIQSLPETIMSNSKLSFIVEAVNYGGYSVPENNIQVELANTNFFQATLSEDLDQRVEGSSLTNAVPLNKRVPELVRGDTAYFNYEDVLFTLPAFAGDTTAISLKTCYYYQTAGLTSICISDDSYGAICNAVGDKETYSSSAPVKVQSVSQINSLRMGPSTQANIRSTLQFKIKYVGDGMVYSKVKDFSCFDQSLTVNSVRINSIRIGSSLIENIADSCGGSELIYLDENGEATLTCNLLTYSGWTTQLGEFEERLTLNLDYVEINVASKDLSII